MTLTFFTTLQVHDGPYWEVEWFKTSTVTAVVCRFQARIKNYAWNLNQIDFHEFGRSEGYRITRVLPYIDATILCILWLEFFPTWIVIFKTKLQLNYVHAIGYRMRHPYIPSMAIFFWLVSIKSHPVSGSQPFITRFNKFSFTWPQNMPPELFARGAECRFILFMNS